MAKSLKRSLVFQSIK